MEKAKRWIYIIIIWWREQQQTQKFELTAKLQPRNGCQNLLCNLSQQKKKGKTPITSSIAWTTSWGFQFYMAYFKRDIDVLVWIMKICRTVMEELAQCQRITENPFYLVGRCYLNNEREASCGRESWLLEFKNIY